MEWLAVGVALAALGFSLSLFKSRPGAQGYANVLVVMPLALSTPLVGVLASGLLLIDAIRRSRTGEGLDAIATGASRAADAQAIGHMATLGLAGALMLVLIVIALRRRRPTPEPASEIPADADAEPPPKPKLSPRHATSLLGFATLACIAGVVTLSQFEQRFVTAPLSIAVSYDADDISEFSTIKRTVDDQRRRISNTLVAETFRTLVVVVLFLVLFDVFLVGSRGLTFNRATLVATATLLILTAALAARDGYRQKELGQFVSEKLAAIDARAAAAVNEAENPEETEAPPN
jgi:hypothetical protein